ncbi:MAG: fatty acid desaturase [Halioglobus sp.]
MTEQEMDVEALKEAQQYMGSFAWPTMILGLAASTLYFAMPFLVYSGLVPFLLAAPLMVVLTYASYTALHEAAHVSISGSHQRWRWINEWVGYLSGLVMGIPLTAHRFEHLTHHRHTNDAELDPDFALSGLTQSPASAVRSAGRAIFENYRHYMNKQWAQGREKQNRTFCLEIAASIAIRVAVVLLTDPGVTIALFLIAGIGGTILLGFLFAYLVHYPYEDVGRYVDTATIVAGGRMNTVITWLWLFQNYHSIHHLFPRVPFYQYRKVFESIEPIMLARGAPVYRLSASGLQQQHAYS